MIITNLLYSCKCQDYRVSRYYGNYQDFGRAVCQLIICCETKVCTIKITIQFLRTIAISFFHLNYKKKSLIFFTEPHLEESVSSTL